jgi:hypothetical protein
MLREVIFMLSLENHLQQVQTGKDAQPGYVGNGSTIPTGEVSLLILILTERSYDE